MRTLQSRQFDVRKAPFSAMREFIETFCAAATLNKQTENHLVLVVDELSANSIAHGYPALPAQTEVWPVWLTLAVTDTQIEALYEDAAPAHNPFVNIDPPDYAGPPETWRIGGWGVPIITRIANDLRYEHSNGRNRIHFALPANRDGQDQKVQDLG